MTGETVDRLILQYRPDALHFAVSEGEISTTLVDFINLVLDYEQRFSIVIVFSDETSLEKGQEKKESVAIEVTAVYLNTRRHDGAPSCENTPETRGCAPSRFIGERKIQKQQLMTVSFSALFNPQLDRLLWEINENSRCDYLSRCDYSEILMDDISEVAELIAERIFTRGEANHAGLST